MASNNYPKFTKIEELPEAERIESGDYIISYTKEGTTSRVNFKNFIIGRENISFDALLLDFASRIASLEGGLAALTASTTAADAAINGNVTALTTRVAALETLVPNNHTAVNARIDTTNQNATILTNRVASLETRVTNVDNTHTASIVALQGRVTALEGSVAVLQQLDVAGALMPTASSIVPPGWLLCNGTAVSRTTYSRLFTAIGTTYGPGDGVTTFNIPDFRGRTAIGQDSGTGRAPAFTSMGAVGGSATHSLTEEENGQHKHFSLVDRQVGDGVPGRVAVTATNSPVRGTSSDASGYVLKSIGPMTVEDVPTVGLTSPSGSGAPHNNMQPSIAINYMIRF